MVAAAWFSVQAINVRLGTKHTIYGTSVAIPPQMCYNCGGVSKVQYLILCPIAMYQYLNLRCVFYFNPFRLRNINIDKESFVCLLLFHVLEMPGYNYCKI